MSLDTYELNMHLRPRWAKNRLNIPLVTPLANASSDQLLSIWVRGKLSSPMLIPEPAPVIRRLLQGSSRAIKNANR
jgi:hypothetical protein